MELTWRVPLTALRAAVGTSIPPGLPLVFGLALALALHQEFRGRHLARTLLITPFLLMPTVWVVLWRNVLPDPR
jgi:ABC-type sugar transport system permease subunit